MPSDDPEKPEGADPPKPADPPAPTPTGPSKEEVQGWVRESLAELLGQGGKPPGEPDLSTDKKIEAYVEEQVQKALDAIKAAEAAEGKPPIDDEPDDTPKPEDTPEEKTTWQQRLQRLIWGGVDV